MAETKDEGHAGDALVKQDLITRNELDHARECEAQSGTPWYKQLIQMRKISFGALEDVLRYEFHSKTTRAEQESLGTTLVKAGALSEARLKEALAEQKRNGRLLGSILLQRGHVTVEDIARALAAQHGMEYQPLPDTMCSPAAMALVPETMAQKYQMLPFELEGDRLLVLVTSPQVRDSINDLSVMLGTRFHVILTASADFKREIHQRYHPPGDPGGGSTDEGSLGGARAVGRMKNLEQAMDVKKAAEKVKTTDIGKGLQGATPRQEQTDTEDADARFRQIAKAASGTSVIKMVATLIEGAVNSGATDIHLDPQDPEMRARYRIDGILHDVMSIPQTLEAAVVSRIKIMADLDITDTRHPQDGHISLELGPREFDVRVATLPTFLGERVVMRLLDQSSVLSGIKDLGLEKEDEEKLIAIVDQPYGMILVTGPTGSGKTTTLYAALNQKNVMTDSIVTLEDPVEYQLSGINQVQIDPDIDVTFANTLRAALRQDIDVLLVGEIRDADTAKIAVRASMTGHLVFSTLHTNDAPEAIVTLRNMGVPSYLISSALTAIIGQRLVRTICPDCRESFTPPPALLKSIGMPATTKKLYRGKGCKSCYQTGNRGRTGIFEILEVTGGIRRLIADDEPIEQVVAAAKMKTMAQRCRQKVKDGIVTAEEYLRVIRA